MTLYFILYFVLTSVADYSVAGAILFVLLAFVIDLICTAISEAT